MNATGKRNIACQSKVAQRIDNEVLMSSFVLVRRSGRNNACIHLLAILSLQEELPKIPFPDQCKVGETNNKTKIAVVDLL